MEEAPRWHEVLRGADSAARDAALADMRDFVRRTLARGFGRRLSDSDLEDLSQDALLRVHEKLDGFRGDSRFSTWVAAIAVNTALGELRRRRHEHVELDAAIEAGEKALRAPRAADRILVRQRNEALGDAIDAALTDRQRQALLAELGGLPMQEIASRMGSTRNALYKLLHDARKRLRRHLVSRGVSLDDLSSANVELSS